MRLQNANCSPQNTGDACTTFTKRTTRRWRPFTSVRTDKIDYQSINEQTSLKASKTIPATQQQSADRPHKGISRASLWVAVSVRWKRGSAIAVRKARSRPRRSRRPHPASQQVRERRQSICRKIRIWLAGLIIGLLAAVYLSLLVF